MNEYEGVRAEFVSLMLQMEPIMETPLGLRLEDSVISPLSSAFAGILPDPEHNTMTMKSLCDSELDRLAQTISEYDEYES